MTKISAIVTAYNIQDFISDAILSLIGQEFEDYEIIVVDDGSLDYTYETVEKYAKAFDFIKLYKTKHKGAGYARNYGFLKSSGDYVLFLDGDDIFHTSMLYEMYREIVNKKADICLCNSNEFSGNKNNIIKRHNNSNDYPIGWAWDKLIKRSLIVENDLKFCDLSSSNDLSFTYAAWFLAKKKAKVEIPLVSRRMWAGSVSYNKKAQNAFLALIDLKEKLAKLNRFDEFREDFYNISQMIIYWHFKTASQNMKKDIFSWVKEYESSLGILNLKKPKCKRCHNFYKDAYFSKSYSALYVKYIVGKIL